MTHADHGVSRGEGRVTPLPRGSRLPDKRQYSPYTEEKGKVIALTRFWCKEHPEPLRFVTWPALLAHVLDHRKTHHQPGQYDAADCHAS